MHFSALEHENREEGLSALEGIADPASLPEEVAESSELRGTLLSAVVSLPLKFRAIVLLHCFKQLTFSEIGHALNMPETTVKTYFYRSLPQLRRALAGEVPCAALS